MADEANKRCGIEKEAVVSHVGLKASSRSFHRPGVPWTLRHFLLFFFFAAPTAAWVDDVRPTLHLVLMVLPTTSLTRWFLVVELNVIIGIYSSLHHIEQYRNFEIVDLINRA